MRASQQTRSSAIEIVGDTAADVDACVTALRRGAMRRRDNHLHRSRPRRYRAVRKLAESDGGEERPVGFAGIEQRADPVVGEPAQSEGGALGSLDEFVHGSGGSVGDPGAVPFHDRVVPAAQGAAQAAQFRRAVGVGEIVGEFAEVGAGELGQPMS